MREQLKRLGAESIVYGLGQVGGRAVQLMLVPVLTRALTPEAFGISELVVGYSQTALLVLVMGMDGALARFFYHEPDTESRIRMVSSSLVFRLVTSVSVAALIALFAGPLSVHLMSGDGYRKYLIIGAATLPFTLLVMFGNDVLRVTFQPWKFISLNILQTVLTTAIALWFVLVQHSGVVGVLYGRLIGDIVSAGVGLVLIRHTVAPRFSRATLRRMLSYGLPAIPGTIAFGLIAGLDRFFMQRTRSLEEVAVYAVALKFFAIVTIAASAFQLAYGPFAFARATTPEAPRLFARVFAAYMAVGSLGALVVSLFAADALRVLVPASYAGAAESVLWLTFAAVALGAYTVTSLGIGLALKTPLIAICSGSGLVVALAAHTVLTPRFGGPGAGAATFLGYATTGYVTYRVAQSVYPLPFRGGRAVALFALAVGLALIAQQYAPAGVPGIGFKIVLVVALIGAVLMLDVLRNGGAIARSWAPPVDARAGEPGG